MPDLLSYLRPLRYDRVSRIALVQTGPADLVSGVIAELRRLFPDAHVEVLLREEDAALVSHLTADTARVVRFEERQGLVRELRGRSYDLIVMQLSRSGARGLRSLPFVLRGRTIVAFNDSLDHFPLNVFRLPDLASHFGLTSQGMGLVLAPLLLVYLVVSTSWIRLRGLWRRLRRPRATPGPRASAPPVDGERWRAAAGAE